MFFTLIFSSEPSLRGRLRLTRLMLSPSYPACELPWQWYVLFPFHLRTTPQFCFTVVCYWSIHLTWKSEVFTNIFNQHGESSVSASVVITDIRSGVFRSTDELTHVIGQIRNVINSFHAFQFVFNINLMQLFCPFFRRVPFVDEKRTVSNHVRSGQAGQISSFH